MLHVWSTDPQWEDHIIQEVMTRYNEFIPYNINLLCHVQYNLRTKHVTTHIKGQLDCSWTYILVSVADSYHRANQQGMNSNFITTEKPSTDSRIPLHQEIALLNTKVRPKGQKYKRGPYNQTKQRWGLVQKPMINVEACATPLATKIQSSNQIQN